MSSDYEVAWKFFSACGACLGWEGCQAFVAPGATFESEDPDLAGIETIRDYCELMSATGAMANGAMSHVLLAWDRSNRIALFLQAKIIRGRNCSSGEGWHAEGKCILAIHIDHNNLMSHITKIEYVPEARRKGKSAKS